jgi:hypothetical protein
MGLHTRHQQLLAATLPKFHPLLKPNVAGSPSTATRAAGTTAAS